MLVAHFDNAQRFLSFVGAGVFERFHLTYPNGDPPANYSVNMLALRGDGSVLGVCDDPLIVSAEGDLPPEWENSIRLSSREF